MGGKETTGKSSVIEEFKDGCDNNSALTGDEIKYLYRAFDANSLDSSRRLRWSKLTKGLKAVAAAAIAAGLLTVIGVMYNQLKSAYIENRTLSSELVGLKEYFKGEISKNMVVIKKLTERSSKYRELEKNILALQKEVPGIGGLVLDAFYNVDQMSLDEIQELPKSEKESYFRKKITENGLTQYKMIYEDWLYPVNNPESSYVSSEYGPRKDPFDPRGKRKEWHYGIDIVSPYDSAIRAVYGGVVYENGFSDNYGYYTLIRHNMRGVDIRILYAHAEIILVSEGQKIRKGQEIALIGDTGKTVGKHLHFEVRGPFQKGKNRAKRVNPVKNSTYRQIVY